MTSLTSLWPLFDLTLTTPRLVLRPIMDDDIPAAVAAAKSGIHDPARSPFSMPWTELPADELGPNMARWYWRCRGGFTPEEWTLLLGIWHDGEFIGCQDIGAKDFATLKTVSTGSWLRQSVQGQGLGKEMRAAVVLYAFDWLKAEVAESDAAVWNTASLGVSRRIPLPRLRAQRHHQDSLGRQSRGRPKGPPHPGNLQAPGLDPAGKGPRSRRQVSRRRLVCRAVAGSVRPQHFAVAYTPPAARLRSLDDLRHALVGDALLREALGTDVCVRALLETNVAHTSGHGPSRRSASRRIGRRRSLSDRGGPMRCKRRPEGPEASLRALGRDLRARRRRRAVARRTGPRPLSYLA
jgi:RimJ/RimL family protein N-acetyltransferase